MTEQVKQPTVSNPVEAVVSSDLCECYTCGYRWERGRNGRHLCSEFMLNIDLDKLKKIVNKPSIAVPDNVSTYKEFSAWVNDLPNSC